MRKASNLPGSLRIALTGAAAALAGLLAAGPRLQAQAPVARLEAARQQADPGVYAAARRYFPGDEQGAAPKRIFRLTREQIDASVAALLPAYQIPSVKTVMARDPLQTNYEYAELLSFNAANHRGLAAWIGAIAERVRKSPSGVIRCAGTPASADCVRSAARGFVIRAFRGDVSEERLEQITRFFLAGVESTGLGQATGDLVEVALNSPSFLFRREIDIDGSGQLKPAQRLQALTYTLADQPPEGLNLSSGDSGQYLATAADARATAAAVAASKPAREKLLRFFSAWLEIKEPAELTISQQAFPEFSSELAGRMIDDTTRFLRAQLAKPAPRLKDITQSNESFVSRALEALAPTRADDPIAAKLAKLDPEERAGILSQPAVLVSHSGPTSTRLVKRGVFWARKVMCLEMEPPPQELHKEVEALYEALETTERQRIERSTRHSACIGCHKVINPFGFFQESYDALGRWRTTDNGHPIDAGVSIDFLDEGPVRTRGPGEALRVLTGSMMFKQCFVRQLFRFYMGRSEKPTDEPLLRRMLFEFANNDNQEILRLVQALASSDFVAKRR